MLSYTYIYIYIYIYLAMAVAGAHEVGGCQGSCRAAGGDSESLLIVCRDVYYIATYNQDLYIT